MGLGKIGIIRREYFSEVNLNNPMALLKAWALFIGIGLIVNYLFKSFLRLQEVEYLKLKDLS